MFNLNKKTKHQTLSQKFNCTHCKIVFTFTQQWDSSNNIQFHSNNYTWQALSSNDQI